MCELESQITEKENKRVAAIAHADVGNRGLDVLRFRCLRLNPKVMRLHSKAETVKQLRAEAARLVRRAEKMTAPLTDTASMHDEAVGRADSLSAQFPASVCREDAYKSELAAVKENLVKACVERANRRW